MIILAYNFGEVFKSEWPKLYDLYFLARILLTGLPTLNVHLYRLRNVLALSNCRHEFCELI